MRLLLTAIEPRQAELLVLGRQGFSYEELVTNSVPALGLMMNLQRLGPTKNGNRTCNAGWSCFGNSEE